MILSSAAMSKQRRPEKLRVVREKVISPIKERSPFTKEYATRIALGCCCWVLLRAPRQKGAGKRFGPTSIHSTVVPPCPMSNEHRIQQTRDVWTVFCWYLNQLRPRFQSTKFGSRTAKMWACCDVSCRGGYNSDDITKVRVGDGGGC